MARGIVDSDQVGTVVFDGDVIIPALDIYLKIMKWAGIDAIYVPQVGLADGIVRILYDRYKASQPEGGNGPSFSK